MSLRTGVARSSSGPSDYFELVRPIVYRFADLRLRREVRVEFTRWQRHTYVNIKEESNPVLARSKFDGELCWAEPFDRETHRPHPGVRGRQWDKRCNTVLDARQFVLGVIKRNHLRKTHKIVLGPYVTKYKPIWLRKDGD